MKNHKFLWIYLLALVIGVTSCEGDLTEEEQEQGQTSCPELSFKQDGKTLIADFEGIENLETYEWYVDDQLVETETTSNDNQRDNTLDLKDYNPGTYKVCIKTETPDCPNGTEFCKEITISETEGESCPTLKYTREGDNLIADFEGIDTIKFYAWQITGGPLGNETIIENEGADFEGDDKYSLANLQSGTYTICLISESPTCTQAEPFCKEIEVRNNTNPLCPKLSFITEGSLLFANFPGINSLDSYEWRVDGQVVETESLQNQDRDNSLDLSSYQPGTYSVCLFAETPDCPNGIEYCADVIIPEPVQVDCSVFDVIYASFGTNEYVGVKVTSLGIDRNSVVWKINGNQVNHTSFTGNILILKDHLTQAGRYEICYKGETSSCGTVEKCINIDFQNL
ncbi:hypothetical protein [Aquimarina algicola]|uniref:Uncharacterized protein n=1 Tax=Aquimarina algicola TaxID=2589995 RepID=A0A504J2Y4_9FLAO|nr:hypothetical protein [Aquimarina algicola]TPN85296.1 hypothetical protein FHK87_14850 [Aquimarina algicola]